MSSGYGIHVFIPADAPESAATEIIDHISEFVYSKATNEEWKVDPFIWGRVAKDPMEEGISEKEKSTVVEVTSGNIRVLNTPEEVEEALSRSWGVSK